MVHIWNACPKRCAYSNDLLNTYRDLIFPTHAHVYQLLYPPTSCKRQVIVCAKPRVRVAEVEEPPQLEAAVGIRKGGANAESPPRPPDRRIEFLWMFRYRPQPFRRFSAFTLAISARDITRKAKPSWRLMNRSRGVRTTNVLVRFARNRPRGWSAAPYRG